jgi:hypothetical protein
MPSVTVQTDQGAKTLNFTKTPTPDVISKVIKQQGWKPKVNTPAPAAKPGIFTQADEAIQKPQVEMSPQNTSGGAGNILPTIGNSIKNSAKDLFSFAYNFVTGVPKAVVGAAKAIPGAVTETYAAGKSQGQALDLQAKLKQSGGAKSGNTDAQNQKIKTGLDNYKPFNAVPQALSTPVVTDLSHGQFSKATQDIAEKPFSNILPYALMAIKPSSGGGYEFRGTGEPGIPGKVADVANKTVNTVGGAVTDAAAAPFKAVISGGKAVINSYEGSGLPKAKITPEEAQTIIQEGIAKGVKPSVEIAGRKATGTRTMGRAVEANDQMSRAVQITAENRSKVNIQINPKTGEEVTGAPPKNAGEAAIATDQAMQAVWEKSQAIIKASGKAGAQFDASPTITKLNQIISNTASTDAEISVAKGMISEIQRLQGADPATIQARLKTYNAELQGFYKGTTNAVTKQVLAEVTSEMRKSMEDSIDQALGDSGNQDLRNQYRDLKTYQQEITHRAIVLARRAPKGLIDFSDIGAATEMVKAFAGLDPVSLAKSLAIKGTAAFIKMMNNPDRYIANMYQAAYDAYPEPVQTTPAVQVSPGATGQAASTPGSILPYTRSPQIESNITK